MNISFWSFRHKGFSIKIEVFSLLFAFILGEANVDWLDDNEVLYIDIEAVMDVSSLMFVSFDRIIISQPSNSDDESRSSLRAESQYDSVLTEIKSRYSLSFWEWLWEDEIVKSLIECNSDDVKGSNIDDDDGGDFVCDMDGDETRIGDRDWDGDRDWVKDWYWGDNDDEDEDEDEDEEEDEDEYEDEDGDDDEEAAGDRDRECDCDFVRVRGDEPDPKNPNPESDPDANPGHALKESNLVKGFISFVM